MTYEPTDGAPELADDEIEHDCLRYVLASIEHESRKGDQAK